MIEAESDGGVGTLAVERAEYPGSPSGPTSGSRDELRAYFDLDFRSACDDDEAPREVDGRDEEEEPLPRVVSGDFFRSAKDAAGDGEGESSERFRVRAARASERLLLMHSVYLLVRFLAHAATSVCGILLLVAMSRGGVVVPRDWGRGGEGVLSLRIKVIAVAAVVALSSSVVGCRGWVVQGWAGYAGDEIGVVLKKTTRFDNGSERRREYDIACGRAERTRPVANVEKRLAS